MMLGIIMAFSFNANAQEKKEGKRQFNPEMMVQKRAEKIANKLELDDATSAKFMETYKAYLKEMHEVYAKYGKQFRGKKDERKSDAQVEQDIKNQFAMSRAIIDVREKYYNKFRAFLNPRQIQVIYSQEREHNDRMKWEKGRRQADEMHGHKGKNDQRGPKNGRRGPKPQEVKQ